MRQHQLPISLANSDKLHSELASELTNKYVGLNSEEFGTVWKALLTDDSTTTHDGIADGVAMAHDPDVLTPEQSITAAVAINRQQLVEYLKTQLTTPNPVTATVRAQAQAYIDESVKLQAAMTNIAALYGYNLGTNAGYLQTALILVSLMT